MLFCCSPCSLPDRGDDYHHPLLAYASSSYVVGSPTPSPRGTHPLFVAVRLILVTLENYVASRTHAPHLRCLKTYIFRVCFGTGSQVKFGCMHDPCTGSYHVFCMFCTLYSDSVRPRMTSRARKPMTVPVGKHAALLPCSVRANASSMLTLRPILRELVFVWACAALL